MTHSDVRDFHACCHEVIRVAKLIPHSQNLQYAASYAKAGLDKTREGDIKAQIPYILSNLGYWQAGQRNQSQVKVP